MLFSATHRELLTEFFAKKEYNSVLQEATSEDLCTAKCFFVLQSRILYYKFLLWITKSYFILQSASLPPKGILAPQQIRPSPNILHWKISKIAQNIAWQKHAGNLLKYHSQCKVGSDQIWTACYFVKFNICPSFLHSQNHQAQRK